MHEWYSQVDSSTNRVSYHCYSTLSAIKSDVREHWVWLRCKKNNFKLVPCSSESGSGNDWLEARERSDVKGRAGFELELWQRGTGSDYVRERVSGGVGYSSIIAARAANVSFVLRVYSSMKYPGMVVGLGRSFVFWARIRAKIPASPSGAGCNLNRLKQEHHKSKICVGYRVTLRSSGPDWVA